MIPNVLQTIKSKVSEGGFKLDQRLVLGGLAAVAAVLALAVAFYLWRDSRAYQPLYGAGEAFPAAEVMEILDAQGLPYRVHPQSGQVMVPETELARARMVLSAQGVKVSLPAGYELFDRDDPLGTSQFIQNVRLKRSLEGELSRSIMALQGVDQARVHLAQEQSSSFVVSRRVPPKASVMVQLRPGYQLKAGQVTAIVNLVSNSVPRMAPEDVSVVDQYGALLSRGINIAGAPEQNWQAVDEYQHKVESNIEDVLAPIVGPGNYRISVAADIDFSQREETLHTLGETPRLRSESVRNESALDQLALGVPGSLSNLPADEANEDEDAENAGATSRLNQETRQLDYDQNIVHVKYPGFAVRQQSISVVLNAGSAPEEGWTAQQRAELEQTIMSAAGFNQTRGDLLTLSIFPFVVAEVPVEEVQWWENNHVHSLIKTGLAGFIGLLVLLTVLRPAVRSLSRSSTAMAVVEDDDDEAALPSDAPRERIPAPAAQATNAQSAFSELNPLSEIQLPSPDSGLELQIEHLQMLAHNDPERVSEVIRHWIGRNEAEVKPAR